MNVLSAVNTGCQKSVYGCGRDKSCSNWWVQTNTGGKTTSQAETPVPPMAGQVVSFQEKLFPLLMTVLSQSFFTLVRRDLMTLSFLTTRHTQIIF